MIHLENVSLYDHQRIAVNKLRNGSILCGGVGSGKSRTSLYYWAKNYPDKHCYIITTAKKRDSMDWFKEMGPFKVLEENYTVDSWNNIGKYECVQNAFFIFDEQRVVGNGSWAKLFIKIAKANNWILLSATPGDTWMDYVPVFVANGFYKNRTEFLRMHVVFNTHVDWPQVDHYINEERLNILLKQILIPMDFSRVAQRHEFTIKCKYDELKYLFVQKDRWNPYDDEPIETSAKYCYTIRRVVNESEDRLEHLYNLVMKAGKSIVFYNYDYELEAIKNMLQEKGIRYAQYNGHYHDPVPTWKSWVYLVQYTAGCEGWNCTTCNSTIFYSNNYSYKIMEQAKGRIDRVNTPFTDLMYYTLTSDAPIDAAIEKALSKKTNFNERNFASL
jgi:hypothetical protein